MSRENKIHLTYFSCGDVRYDFCIEMVFGSSLPPIVCRGLMSYLRLLAHSGVQHILTV